ncbi:uncharacterized protein [Pyxicephalus adspersus]|uniref:uncharacterized protein isoform X2 n=1 Tax=Pyxicephalus adspersus TaxID=30357 RepID=UPI003B5A0F63
MDSKVIAFELQDCKVVNKQKVSLSFPRPSESCLYVVTNQKSKCHFFQDTKEQQSFNKISSTKKNSEEMLFQYGVSTKVFSVTDPKGTEWEVRLLLSPSEISRLSSAFNFIGYFSTYLDDIVKKFHAQLSNMVNQEIRESCKDLPKDAGIMVAGMLTALMAAELAASLGGSKMFDYKGEKSASQENMKEKIQDMVNTFDLQAEHLEISHQGKMAQVIFRNPCPDNWASGGRKCMQTGETLEFGLCHKVFSMSEEKSEIQFLQSLQESYDMIPVFHIAGFTEQVLMTKKWRKTLEVLLKEGQNKETINELSQMALNFVCSTKCNAEIFLYSFTKEMAEKCSKVKTFPAGGETIRVFGLLVAIMAALKAKSIADGLIAAITPSTTKDIVHPATKPCEVAPDCVKIGLPITQEVDHPKPETIGPNLGESDDTVHEATKKVDEMSRVLADGPGDENVDHFDDKANRENNETSSSRTPRVGTPDTEISPLDPEDVSHPPSIEKPSDDQIDSNTNCPVSNSNIETCTPGEPPVGLLPPEGPQDVSEITLKLDTSDIDEVGIQDPNEDNDGLVSPVNSVVGGTSEGQVQDPENGLRTTFDENTLGDTMLRLQSVNSESSSEDTKKATNTQDIDDGDKTSTFNSDLSTQVEEKTNKSDIDQPCRRPVRPCDIDQKGKETSSSAGTRSSFLVLLNILAVTLVIVPFEFPSWLTSVFFRGLALMLGIHLFLSRRP